MWMNASERETLIRARRMKIEGRHERLWCRDDWMLFDVYKVAVELLILNVDNRRFAAERKLYEEQIGRSLDPENSPADEHSLVVLLTERGVEVDGDRLVGKGLHEDFVALRDDWLRRRQETPFWIRPDGLVRNGNRRLAVLKRLREGGTEGAEWVEAIVIERSAVDDGELFKMEQREQLTQNFKVQYSDINRLLALRDAALAADIDFYDETSLDRVAGELQYISNGDEKYTLLQLRAIKYMDAFLEYVRAPGQYQKLLRQVERFRDVARTMAKIEGQYPDDAPGMLQVMFAAIQASRPHGDIREIRKMFVADRDRYAKLATAIEGAEREWEEEGDRSLADPEVSPTDADEEDDDGEPPGPVVPRYPKDKVGRLITNAIDGFSSSQLDVASKLEQALSRLEMVDGRRLKQALATPDGEAVRGLLDRLFEWTKVARKQLDK